MSVSVDCDSARKLVAEGAICVESNSFSATRENKIITMKTLLAEQDRPILVCGSSYPENLKALRRLEKLGLSPWLVLHVACSENLGCHCCIADDTCGGGPSRAE